MSIDYTVAPAGKWQRVTDEVLAVFAALQKDGYKLRDIAIYGESAGGALAAGSVLKMRDSKYQSDVREFEITDRGIRVLAPLRSAQGLLTGQAVPIGSTLGEGAGKETS